MESKRVLFVAQMARCLEDQILREQQLPALEKEKLGTLFIFIARDIDGTWP